MVELVLGKVKAAHQRPDRPIARVDGDECALHLGQLGDFPGVLDGLGHADHGTTADLDVRGGFVGQTRLGWLETFAGNIDRLAVLAHGLDVFAVGFEHHGRHHVAVVGVLVQRVKNGFFEFLLGGGQGDKLLRSAVDLAAFKVHDAPAQRFVGGGLVGAAQRGGHVQATRIGFVTVLGIDQLAHHFCNKFGVHLAGIAGGADFEFLLLGGCGVLLRDKAVFQHPVDDVALAHACTFGVADRVVGGRGLGQSGQHGGFGNRDVLERLAKVGFAGGCKTVGPVAQEDLVHVDLKDLVLAEHVFELEGQQDFVNLAGKRLFGRQVHVARHLHGDGRGPLALDLADVGQTGAQHAQVIHPAVLVEARVFNRQHRIDHDLRDFANRGQVSPLFAKFADQIAFFRVDAQRQLGAVVGQVRDVGQVRKCHRQRQPEHDGNGQYRCRCQAHQAQDQRDQPVSGATPRSLGRVFGVRGWRHKWWFGWKVGGL